MFKSTIIRATLALPVLSALALMLVSGPSPAQTSPALAPNLAPGQARVMTAAPATVVSSVHYQAELDLSCGSFCAGDFPAPGPHHQLTVTRVSCLLESSGASTVQTGWIELVTLSGAHLLYEHLPVDYSDTSSGVHQFNRAVDVRVGSQQHIKVRLVVDTNPAALGICTATGTLDTLQ